MSYIHLSLKAFLEKSHGLSLIHFGLAVQGITDQDLAIDLDINFFPFLSFLRLLARGPVYVSNIIYMT